MRFKTATYIKNGGLDLSCADFKLFCATVERYSNSHRVAVDIKVVKDAPRKRSIKQNSFYWGHILPIIADCMSEDIGERVSVQECHEVLKAKFLNCEFVSKSTGELFAYVKSTTDLTRSEFTEYIDQVSAWAINFYDLNKDLFNE
jgi:hypothetical protein